MTAKGWYEQLTPEQRERENRRRRRMRKGRGGPEHTMTREEYYARQGLEPPALPEADAA